MTPLRFQHRYDRGGRLRRTARPPWSFALLGLVLVAGCSGGGSSDEGPVEPPEIGEPGVFESATPTGSDGRNAGEAGDSATTSAPSGPADGAADSDAERAIEEADIIKIDGGRLYALSRYGGLSVIDVSVRDELRLLGRHRITATPFEMYVRGDVVIALYNDYPEYRFDEANDQWQSYQTSYVVVLDTSDPAAIAKAGRFAVTGAISDSRIVGDILYVAAYENGQCWGCGTAARTHVMSLDVSDPAEIVQVDELAMDERLDTYSWKRSLSVTDQRMYIAGPAYGATEPVGSLIQIVDISDPNGDLREGATVQVSGQIDSRWQMDEYEGVLRTVSQPFTWNLDAPPVVQTFQVVSSDEITPLGSTTLTLPRPERLQAARFDGLRGYAITAERTDPLFTIDLSNPALPVQAGELEMPGWVYHMEPRGDRVVGLGFDQGNPEGALTVSLFDVSDLSNPSMLNRVNFGGDWANLAEGQDQIHKAFNVLDESGLILVPFSGYSFDESDTCGYGSYVSGVELVDWAGDDLVLRGVAPSKGDARRGFLHDERLFTMSDERVEAFDIADRDNPRSTALLPLAQIVERTVSAGDDHVVRIVQDWWTRGTEIDVTSVVDAELPTASGRLRIAGLEQNDCNSSSWLADVKANDEVAYFLYQTYHYDEVNVTSRQALRIVTVDVSDPSSPAVVADAELGDPAEFYSAYGGYYGLTGTGEGMVAIGSTLVTTATRYGQGTDGAYRITDSVMRVIDLSNPAVPVVASVDLPAASQGSGLLVSGSIVATSHFEPIGTDGRRVRFFLDRVDVSDPAHPRRLPSLNVPGALVAFDAESSRAVTVDYRPMSEAGLTVAECSERYGYAYSFEPAGGVYLGDTTIGTCAGVQHVLKLVALSDAGAHLLGSHALEVGQYATAVARGDDRLFVSVGQGYGYYGVADVGAVGVAADSIACLGCYYGFAGGTQTLVTLGGLSSGELVAGSVDFETGDMWGYGYAPVVASGQRAVFATGFRGKLGVVDATDPAAPEIVREVDLPGSVNDLRVVGDTAVASMYYDGVATIRVR